MTPRAAAVNDLARDILAAFGERDALVHLFAWQAARSKSGGAKAVWTGGGKRRPLYGKSAEKALGGKKEGGDGVPVPGPKPMSMGQASRAARKELGAGASPDAVGKRAAEIQAGPKPGGGTGGPNGFGTDKYAPLNPSPPVVIVPDGFDATPPGGPRRSETAAPRTGVTPQGNRVTLQPRKPATMTPTEPRLTGEARTKAIDEAVKAQGQEHRRLSAGAKAGAVPTGEILKQNQRIDAAFAKARDAFDGKPAPPPSPAETAHLDAAQAKDTARFGPRGASILRRAAEAVRGLLTLGGLVTGAGLGATIGTAVGGPLGMALGTAVGGGLGGLLGSKVVGDGRSAVSRRKDARTTFAETGLPPNAAAILKARLLVAAQKAGVAIPPIPPGAIEKALEMATQDADAATMGDAMEKCARFADNIDRVHRFAWVKGKRSRYWLPDGAQDVPKNRKYGKAGEAAAAAAGSTQTKRNPGVTSKSRGTTGDANSPANPAGRGAKGVPVKANGKADGRQAARAKRIKRDAQPTAEVLSPEVLARVLGGERIKGAPSPPKKLQR